MTIGTARTPLLRAEGLEVGYAGVPVCAPVDVLVEPGRAVGVVGANGAGNSTLLQTLVGLLEPLGGTCLVGWSLAAVAAGHPARQAQALPALDRLLPLSTTGVTVARAVVPLVLVTAVTALTGLLIGLTGDTPLLWTGLCAATAPAWAAAALRGAFRPEMDWAGPVVSTPMGVLPVGAGAGFVQGVDVGVLGSLPVAAALVTGGPTPVLLAVQLLWSVLLGAGALALVARSRGRRG